MALFFALIELSVGVVLILWFLICMIVWYLLWNVLSVDHTVLDLKKPSRDDGY